MFCLSKHRLDTKLLKIHLFNVFTIKRPRALAALAPLGLLIMKTLTNVLQLLRNVQRRLLTDHVITLTSFRVSI